MKKMSKFPTNANRVLSAVRKMFNMAEVWGMRPDGSNPCRHVPEFPERGKTRLITDAELKRLYAHLSKAEDEGLEHLDENAAQEVEIIGADRPSQ